MKRFCISLLAGVSALSSTTVLAQVVPDAEERDEQPPTIEPPIAPLKSLDESDGIIVVTAQRRAERLEEVPISITNLDTEDLRQAGAESLTDISKIVPGLRFDTRAGLVQPTIRGVGTPINLAGAGTNVGIYIDGFYNPAPLASDFQLLNVDSIQVLKGPQGTLFGRNTSGGAILVSTTQPSTETASIIQLSYGSYNAVRAQTYATTGLGDNVAVDVGALFSRGDGYVTNIAPKDIQFNNQPGDEVGRYENWSVRTAIKVDLSDSLSFTLRYIHDERDDPTPILFQPFLQNGRPLSRSSYVNDVLVPTAPLEPYTIAADERLAIFGNTDTVQLAGTLDMGFGTLSSYSMYRKDTATQFYSLDYGVAKILALIYPDDNKTFTQELILTSNPGGRLQYTLGAFYYDNVETYPGVEVSFAGLPFVQTAESGVNSVSIAGFADVTYEILDNLFLTAGLRYTHDTQKDAYFVTSGLSNPPLVRVNVPALKNDKFTPRAVIRYELNPSSSVYASYSQGFKSGILNVGGGSLDGIRIEPETIDAFEVGFKHGSRTLNFSLSSYYYRYKDQQVTANFNVGTPPVPQSVLRNAAASNIYGADAELQYRFTPDFRVNLGIAYNHARYSDFTNAPFYQELPNHAFTVVTVDATGNRMARAPDFTGTAGVAYGFDLGGGKLDLSGSLYYTSKFFFDTVEQFGQDAYATLALRAEWVDPTERFTIGVAGSNVTDTQYLTVGSANSAGIASAYGAPRTVEGYIRFEY